MGLGVRRLEGVVLAGVILNPGLVAKRMVGSTVIPPAEAARGSWPASTRARRTEPGDRRQPLACQRRAAALVTLLPGWWLVHSPCETGQLCH